MGCLKSDIYLKNSSLDLLENSESTLKWRSGRGDRGLEGARRGEGQRQRKQRSVIFFPFLKVDSTCHGNIFHIWANSKTTFEPAVKWFSVYI